MADWSGFFIADYWVSYSIPVSSFNVWADINVDHLRWLVSRHMVDDQAVPGKQVHYFDVGQLLITRLSMH